jgi:hypothetical protein
MDNLALAAGVGAAEKKSEMRRSRIFLMGCTSTKMFLAIFFDSYFSAFDAAGEFQQRRTLRLRTER